MKSAEDLNSSLPLGLKLHVFPINWRSSDSTDTNILWIGEIKIASYQPKDNGLSFKVSHHFESNMILLKKECDTEEDSETLCIYLLNVFLKQLETE